jgi:AcrR family transcriptional regulator
MTTRKRTMRADAARNVDAVLQTGARLLADDPSASMGAIAAEAGVDRRTVYRRFASRDALLCAVFAAKAAAAEEVLDGCRLHEAPVPVALHRLVEGIVAVMRRYPVEPEQVGCPAEAHARMLEHRDRVGAFLGRAVDEGVLRPDLPDGLATALVLDVIALVSTRFPELDCGRAADVAVDILLNGLGRS